MVSGDRAQPHECASEAGDLVLFFLELDPVFGCDAVALVHQVSSGSGAAHTMVWSRSGRVTSNSSRWCHMRW